METELIRNNSELLINKVTLDYVSDRRREEKVRRQAERVRGGYADESSKNRQPPPFGSTPLRRRPTSSHGQGLEARPLTQRRQGVFHHRGSISHVRLRNSQNMPSLQSKN